MMLRLLSGSLPLARLGRGVTYPHRLGLAGNRYLGSYLCNIKQHICHKPRGTHAPFRELHAGSDPPGMNAYSVMCQFLPILHLGSQKLSPYRNFVFARVGRLHHANVILINNGSPKRREMLLLFLFDAECAHGSFGAGFAGGYGPVCGHLSIYIETPALLFQTDVIFSFTLLKIFVTFSLTLLKTVVIFSLMALAILS